MALLGTGLLAAHSPQVDGLKHHRLLYAPDTSAGSGGVQSGSIVTPDLAAIVPTTPERPLPRPAGRTSGGLVKPAGRNRVDAHISVKMRARRKLVGLSQEALADRLHVPVQQVQKHERGRSRIDPVRLSGIARALGVDVAYFYEDMAMTVQEDGGCATTPATRAVEPRPEVVNLVHTILFGILARPETVELIRSYGRIADPRLRRSVFDIIDKQDAGTD